MVEKIIKQEDYITRFDKLHEMDPRVKKTEFYHAFIFDELYSRAMIVQIMNGSRKPESNNFYIVLSNALDIYSKNIIDNRPFFEHDDKSESIVMSTYRSTCRLYPEYKNPDRFGNVTNYPGVSYAPVLRSKVPTAGAVDAYEAMTLGLLISFPRDRNDFYTNMRDYRRIQNLIMRAQLGDGFNVKTLKELSEETGIDYDDLKHPERLCKVADRYMAAYEKLIKSVPYLNIKSRNKRWTRSMSY